MVSLEKILSRGLSSKEFETKVIDNFKTIEFTEHAENRIKERGFKKEYIVDMLMNQKPIYAGKVTYNSVIRYELVYPNHNDKENIVYTTLILDFYEENSKIKIVTVYPVTYKRKESYYDNCSLPCHL